MASPTTSNLTGRWMVAHANINENSNTLHYWWFMRGLCWWPVDCRHKQAIIRKVFPYHDGIIKRNLCIYYGLHQRHNTRQAMECTKSSTPSRLVYSLFILDGIYFLWLYIRTLLLYELVTIYRNVTNTTIFHARDLRKLALSCKQLRLSCQPDPWNVPGTALLSEFESSPGVWNLLIKAVLSKCAFISNKWPLMIWEDHEVQSNVYVGPVNVFLPNFWHLYHYHCLHNM